MSKSNSNEHDDYQSDIRFGEWMRSQRVRVGLSLEQAAESSKIPTERLKALELGFAERGITKPEVIRICAVYQLPSEEFLAQAAKA